MIYVADMVQDGGYLMTSNKSRPLVSPRVQKIIEAKKKAKEEGKTSEDKSEIPMKKIEMEETSVVAPAVKSGVMYVEATETEKIKENAGETNEGFVKDDEASAVKTKPDGSSDKASLSNNSSTSSDDGDSESDNSDASSEKSSEGYESSEENEDSSSESGEDSPPASPTSDKSVTVKNDESADKEDDESVDKHEERTRM